MMINDSTVIFPISLAQLGELIESKVANAIEQFTEKRDSNPEKLLSRKQAATYLGISMTTLAKYTIDGTIKATRLGQKKIYYTIKDLNNARKDLRTYHE